MQKMPNFNDVFLSIMASFIGFGLVIGIAQAAFNFGGSRALLLSSPVFAQVLSANPVETPTGVILPLEPCPAGQVFYSGVVGGTNGSCRTGSCPTGYTSALYPNSAAGVTPLYQCVMNTDAENRGVTSCPLGQILQYSNNYATGTGYCVANPDVNVTRVPLTVGWNLVSLPLEPAKPLIGEVLASIKGKYSRATSFSAGGATLYSPSVASVSTLKELHAGQGFMIYMTAGATLIYEATNTATGNLPALNVGWNLVGPIGVGKTLNISETLVDMNQYIVYTLKTGVKDPAAEEAKAYYPSITSFLSTKGYWIKKLNDTEVAAKAAEAKKYLDAQCIVNALEKRDNAILTGMDSYASTIRNLVVVRGRELKNAWLQFSNRTARKAEIARVWTKYRTDIKYMARQSNSLRINAWKQYTIDRKACGIYATSDDYTSVGTDSSLQMFTPTL